MDTEILCIVVEQVKFKYGHEVPILCTVIQDKSFLFINSEYLNSYLRDRLVQGKLIIIKLSMVLHKPRYDIGQFSDLYTVAYPP
jgi:hypothetical protein